MKRKKILWLCSWYPSSAYLLNGDFIQRHAKAASLYNDIYLIHVAGTNDKRSVTISSNKTEGLSEKIILYKNTKGIGSKLVNHFTWERLYKKAVKEFIKEYGKPDLVHVHVPVKAGLIALWIENKFSVPYLVTEHFGIYNNILQENYSTKPTWFKKLTKKIFLKAIKNSSVSNYLATNIKRYVSPAVEFEIINNVADTDLFFHKPKLAGKFRFIHVSNMISLKNAEGILMVFCELQKSIKNIELIIVGENYFSLERMAKDFQLLNKSVFFRGELSYKKVAEEMQEADCLVLFSNIENSPCVIGEALCCGLPVIATKVGGIPELVSPDNSILVDPGDTKHLEEAMNNVITNYSVFNKTKIAEDAKGKFSYYVIGKKINDLYDSLLK